METENPPKIHTEVELCSGPKPFPPRETMKARQDGKETKDFFFKWRKAPELSAEFRIVHLLNRGEGSRAQRHLQYRICKLLLLFILLRHGFLHLHLHLLHLGFLQQLVVEGAHPLWIPLHPLHGLHRSDGPSPYDASHARSKANLSNETQTKFAITISFGPL